MENNLSYKSGANSKLYNVAMKVLSLSSHIFIWTSPVYFAVMKFRPATSIYLSFSPSETGNKY